MTHTLYERALIVEAYESTLLVRNKHEKTKETKKKWLGPSVVFYVRLVFLEIKPLKRIANEMSCLYLFISPNYAKWFLPSPGLVTFTCHLPRDKFCKKYLSDPEDGVSCQLKRKK